MSQLFEKNNLFIRFKCFRLRGIKWGFAINKAKPHKINCDEPALRALDAQKLRNFRLGVCQLKKEIDRQKIQRLAYDMESLFFIQDEFFS